MQRCHDGDDNDDDDDDDDDDARYYRGAELRMHVDRVATHVFSVIINLEQEGTDSDWPLEVVGFDGVRSEVPGCSSRQ